MAPPQADVSVLDELTARAAQLAANDPRCQRPDWRAETVALLPARLPAGPPELQLVLAQLHLLLWADLTNRPLPDWQTRVTLPQARLAWLRTELALYPQHLSAHLPSPLLRPALASLDAATLPAPLALATQLMRCAAADLQQLVLPLARAALHAGRIDPEPVHALLLELLLSAFPAVQVAALEELAQPWALCFPYSAAVAAARTPTGSVAVARAALRLAAAAGQDGPLRGVVADAAATPALRREALRLLAPLGHRDDLGPVLAMAREDPLLLGKEAVFFLHGRHQRGHFVAAEHVAPLLDLYLGNTELLPETMAPVLYPARGAFLDYVATFPPEDPHWERLLPLLCELGPDEPEVAPLLRTLLQRTTQPHRQQQILASLATLRDAAAEPLVLTLLPVLPAAALQTLRAVGGPRTAAALATALGLPTGEIAGWLLPFSDRAVVLLWQLLDEDAPERALLLTRLNPAALPRDIRHDLGVRPLPAEATLRRLADANDTLLPAAAALRTAALSGDVGAAEALLLRCVSSLHGGAGKPPSEWGEETPRVPGEALGGVRALGKRLYERGRIRPLCLLDAKDAGQAGERLLAELTLRLLGRSDLAEGERIILLNLLHLDVALWALPQLAARLRPLLRDRSPHVRKLAIRCLARRDAERLAHNLTRLLGADDIQTVRQTLLALGGMKARFAAVAIAECLEHPNMNIKKAAAEALAQAGTPQVVPRLLFWLGYHDNPGFRELLLAALSAILGLAQRATLRAAQTRATTPRERELFSAALGVTYSPSATLTKREPVAEQCRPQIAQLVQKGWQDSRARAVLSALAAPDSPSLHVTERASLRPYLLEWLGLGTDAVSLIAQVCEGSLTKQEQTLLAAHLDLLLAALPNSGAGRTYQLDLLEQLAPHLRPAAALRVAAAYRELAPLPNLRGRPPFALLRACAALLQESDLHRALAECAGTSDPPAGVRAVLSAAFAPAAEATDDAAQEARAALRAGTRAGERDLLALRDGWPLTNRPRTTLQLLAEAYPAATAPLVLSWLLAVQTPFIAPTGDDAKPPPRLGKEQAPIRLTLRTQWLAQLGALVPEERRAAARSLLQLPDLVAQDAVLTAYLSGALSGRKEDDALDLTVLAQRLAAWSEDRVRQAAKGTGQRRIAQLGAVLPLAALPRFIPLLLRFWSDDDAALAAAAATALRRLPAEELLVALEPLLTQDRWGALDLLNGTVQTTPAWTALLNRLDAAGHTERAAALRKRTIAGPLAGAASAATAWAELHDREHTLPAPQPTLAPALPRHELLQLARQTDRNQAEPVRAALSALA